MQSMVKVIGAWGCLVFLLIPAAIVLCIFLELYLMIIVLGLALLSNIGTIIYMFGFYNSDLRNIRWLIVIHVIIAALLSCVFIFLIVEQETSEKEDTRTKGALQVAAYVASLLYNFIMDIMILLYETELQSLLPLLPSTQDGSSGYTRIDRES